MKQYAAYKESGIEWIGEIPKHWDIIPLKYLLLDGHEGIKIGPFGSSLKLEIMQPEGFKVYCQENIIKEDFSAGSKYISREKYDELQVYKIAPKDIVVTMMGTTGKAKVVPDKIEPGIMDSHLIRMRCNGDSNPYLISLLINDSNYVLAQIKMNGKGAIMEGLNSSIIKSLQILIPPSVDQEKIIAYLDHKTHLIDTLIEKKQKQIELLQEQRFALIHDAIQDASTQTMRIGHVTDQIFRPINRKDDDIYTPVGLYNRGRGIFHKEPTIGADLGDSNFFWIEKDDLILSGQFAWEGAVALASENDSGCVATHRYPILRGKTDKMETAYLFAYFTSREGDFLLNQHSRGAAGRNRPLNAGTLLREPIPVPTITAQSLVSAHVHFEQRFRPIVTKSIQLLQEYRTTLISEVVTGKIDVRDEVIP